LFGQYPCRPRADPVTLDAEGIGAYRPVAGRLQALLQFVSPRKFSGGVLERGPWL